MIVVITEHRDGMGKLLKATVDVINGKTLSEHKTVPQAQEWADHNGHQVGGVQPELDLDFVVTDETHVWTEEQAARNFEALESLTERQRTAVTRITGTTAESRRRDSV